MARATSYDWEIDIDGQIIYPNKIGELGGEEGKIEVVDGESGYSIRDQVIKFSEISVEIDITDDRSQFDIMEKFVKDRRPRDVFIVGRDGNGTSKMTFLLEDCDCVSMNKSEFDRTSKTADIKTYELLPRKISNI